MEKILLRKDWYFMLCYSWSAEVVLGGGGNLETLSFNKEDLGRLNRQYYKLCTASSILIVIHLERPTT